MTYGQWQKSLALVVAAAMTIVLAGSAQADECRIDWNGDYQIDETDYLVGDPMGGYYAEWYVCMYYPIYYPSLFIPIPPPATCVERLDYDNDGGLDDDDLMGPLDATAAIEGFYVEWYIFMYYPGYYPVFFPEYDVCPPVPVASCADFEVIDVGGPDGPGLPWFFAELAGKLYFGGIDPVAGSELMVYDPVSGSVTVASDINPGPGSSNARDLIAHEGKLYFQANDYIGGYNAELFVFDPATGVSTKIELNPSGSAEPTEFFSASNGLLYFRARDAVVGQELYEFDPATGQYNIYEFIPGADQFGNLLGGAPFVQLEHDGKLYMSAHGPVGKELYSFDMVSKQIELITDIAPGSLSSYPLELTLFNGEIFFNALKDGYRDSELWIYNPTTSAVREIVIDDGHDIFGAVGGGGPMHLTEYNGKLYMSAQQIPVGVELFVYDPATDAVTLEFDSYPGQYEYCNTCGPLENRYPCPPCGMVGNNGLIGEMIRKGDKLYYVATQDNMELWEYDLVTGIGQPFLEFYPGNDQAGNPGHGFPKYITDFDDKLVFRGSTDTLCEELIIVSWAPENCP